ncbi:GFA family protein [Aspergillus ibericus CBS 121593]|uniref:CENP-V/GFA domain-containing protein n=1 Tax=Aspergillus ibericus CBS 121593 TaxID=1448316 RepID=A0A395H872_9EURO|nr:hypothetical protein BO80DRAFT_500602 [Aspergillus ibericus CBS 121593]RAL03345.1 hypothetical protein BO80DRAFT_500602 [Aspergillus ibericus CBS 121593]
MAVGSCFCGKIQIKYNAPIIASGLCHCTSCRKLTSAPFSYSFIIKTAELEITGNPKEVPKIADSGNQIKNYFCPDCGTPLYGQKINEDGQPDQVTIVRAGVFDDERLMEERKPEVEIYTDRRLPWISPVEGAAQCRGMLPP